jgi:Holliday junction resolvasome RuvABC endonuclease subunit
VDKYNIQQVVIEDIYLQKDKQHVFKLLSGLQHCVCCMLSKKNIPFELVSAKKWREFAGIKNTKRGSAKNESIKQTQKKYGVNREDESEAINICQAYINMAGGVK